MNTNTRTPSENCMSVIHTKVSHSPTTQTGPTECIAVMQHCAAPRALERARARVLTCKSIAQHLADAAHVNCSSARASAMRNRACKRTRVSLRWIHIYTCMPYSKMNNSASANARVRHTAWLSLGFLKRAHAFEHLSGVLWIAAYSSRIKILHMWCGPAYWSNLIVMQTPCAERNACTCNLSEMLAAVKLRHALACTAKTFVHQCCLRAHGQISVSTHSYFIYSTYRKASEPRARSRAFWTGARHQLHNSRSCARLPIDLHHNILGFPFVLRPRLATRHAPATAHKSVARLGAMCLCVYGRMQ